MASATFIMLLMILLPAACLGWFIERRMVYCLLTLLTIYLISTFIGLRSFNSGVDTPAYIAYFRGDELTPRQFEIGFALFTQVFRVFGSAEWYIWGIAMVQVLSMALAARLLGIRNLAVVLIAYIAFLPGLDMLTNGMRNGLALTLGMPILIATTINRASMRLFNFLPATLHLSYMLISFAALTVERLASVRRNVLIFGVAAGFAAIWTVSSPAGILNHVAAFSQGYFGISKLVRYLLIQEELMSGSVKSYFVVLSLAFSLFYIAILYRSAQARQDNRLTKLAYISFILQLLYMMVSFSEYSFRFMFIVYPIQILMFVYLAERYLTRVPRTVIITATLATSIGITYTTNTFGGYQLLDVF